MSRLRIATGSVILAIWSLSLLKGLLTGDYQGAEIATPVMLLSGGYLFGDGFLRKRYVESSDDH